MNRPLLFLLLPLLFACPAPVTAQLPLPPLHPSNSLQARRQSEILGRMSHYEHDLLAAMRTLTPRVETYLQMVRPTRTLGSVPTGDEYFLSRVDWHNGLSSISFLPEPQKEWQQWMGPLTDHVTRPLRESLTVHYLRNGFVQMLFPDARHFDQEHYTFQFVREQFLGQVRCYVFDVAPRLRVQRHGFWGRIWVEDRNDILVRFNGAYWGGGRNHPALHFDSWRSNVAPRIWLPTNVFSQENDLRYGLFRHARFRAQTRLWGYSLRYWRHRETRTNIQIEGAELGDNATSPPALSPAASRREWQRQAEDNILQRLQRAGLLAPQGPVDQVLTTVVNNLIVTNHLNIVPAVRCRVLLTTPLDAFSIGHTIVFSRGLVDTLPNEASLAALLARELAHIVLGHSINTDYAFADRMLFPDHDSFEDIHLRRPLWEEMAADKKALQLLEHSPYRSQLGSAGLYLRALAEAAPDLPHLTHGELGNSITGADLADLAQLMQQAPPLQPLSLKQTAALPLGGRIDINPWTDGLSFDDAPAVPLLSPQEKMPFLVAPFYLDLTRSGVPLRAPDTQRLGEGPRKTARNEPAGASAQPPTR